MMCKDLRINVKFGGKMNLCDFGAQLHMCPGGNNCMGPGGTVYSPERLYNWNVWYGRKFLRDSFLAMFPDRAEELAEKVYQSEYKPVGCS